MNIKAAAISYKKISEKNYEDSDFLKFCEKYDFDRQKEEDNLSILELKVYIIKQYIISTFYVL